MERDILAKGECLSEAVRAPCSPSASPGWRSPFLSKLNKALKTANT